MPVIKILMTNGDRTMPLCEVECTPLKAFAKAKDLPRRMFSAADRIASCAKNHGVGNCNDVPKTNHWRN